MLIVNICLLFQSEQMFYRSITTVIETNQMKKINGHSINSKFVITDNF